MKTQVFAHKGVLGVFAHLKEGKFLNDPMADGQLGMVVSTAEIEMSREARELFNAYKREGGSFAPIMLTDHGDGTGSVGFLGFGKLAFPQIEIGRTCDLKVLDMIEIKDIEAPADFIQYVEKNF